MEEQVEIRDFIQTYRDLESCYVCSEYMGPFKNELTVVTGFSEKTIHQFIEDFVEEKIPDDLIDLAGICQNCFIKFNEYDEFQTKADQMKAELTELYRREIIEYMEEEVDLKPEPLIKSEIEQEGLLYNFDENVEVVDIMPEDIILATTEDTLPTEMKTEKHVVTHVVQKISPLKRFKRDPNNRADKDAGLEVVMKNGLKFYKCEFCGKDDFTSRSRVRTHRQIHTDERNYACEICGACFKTLNCLKNHTRLHNNIYYHCDHCPSKFKGKHELKCHMEAIHLGKKDHVCKVCGKAFSRDKTLRQHMMYHINERNFTCETCGFKTVNRPKMNRHMKSHTKERNYECPICFKRFLYSYNVTAHVKHVHYREKRPATNSEKLVCTICGKKFQKIWKVQEHMAAEHNVVEAELVTDDGVNTYYSRN